MNDQEREMIEGLFACSRQAGFHRGPGHPEAETLITRRRGMLYSYP